MNQITQKEKTGKMLTGGKKKKTGSVIPFAFIMANSDAYLKMWKMLAIKGHGNR